jgi:hypothetical protein
MTRIPEHSTAYLSVTAAAGGKLSEIEHQAGSTGEPAFLISFHAFLNQIYIYQ